MKNIVVWVIGILILIIAAVWYMNRPGPATAPTALPEEGVSPPMVVALSAQNDSGMSGVARLTDTDGSTIVELELTGAPEGVAQPAHIHTGSCAEIGGVVYPLEFPVNGVSVTVLNVSLDDLRAQLPLALNVHKSAEEANVYVACGDLL